MTRPRPVFASRALAPSDLYRRPSANLPPGPPFTHADDRAAVTHVLISPSINETPIKLKVGYVFQQSPH